MKNAAMMKKNAPRFVDDNHVLVTKEFAKNARIFGTPEYKMWREIKQDCEDAEMVTKTIKKNPNKKSYKNLTYANMELFITEQNSELLVELRKQIKLSKVQSNPYRAVLAWFLSEFPKYDEYKEFWASIEAEAENDTTAADEAVA